MSKDESAVNKAHKAAPLGSDVLLKKWCNQDRFIPFTQYCSGRNFESWKKVGEGIYGDQVYFYNENGEESVIKIIPVGGDLLVNNEIPKSVEDVFEELTFNEQMHNLRNNNRLFYTDGFVELKGGMKGLVGRYPKKLIDLWYDYANQNGIFWESPEVFQSNNQEFIVMEMVNAGTEIKKSSFDSPEETLSVFLQVSYSMAIAEQVLEFEHRDLHWGNVLVKPTSDKYIEFIFDGKTILVPSKGVKATIVDFNFSRMLHQSKPWYNNLAIISNLFKGVNPDEQFRLFERMQRVNNNEWEHFEPYTNVLWLRYLLDRFINRIQYNGKINYNYFKAMGTLRALQEEVLDYNSTVDFISECRIINELWERVTLNF